MTRSAAQKHLMQAMQRGVLCHFGNKLLVLGMVLVKVHAELGYCVGNWYVTRDGERWHISYPCCLWRALL